MRRQQADATRGSRRSVRAPRRPPRAPKPIGFVAVAAGSGLVEILKSLGADVVVSGGQTMNPSTEDLADAIARVDADDGQSCCRTTRTSSWRRTQRPQLRIVRYRWLRPTAFPQAFSRDAGTRARSGRPRSRRRSDDRGRRTRTQRARSPPRSRTPRARRARFKAGQVIGIAEHEIEVVGDSVSDVALELSDVIVTPESETLTVLAGADLTDADLAELTAKLRRAHPDLEVEIAPRRAAALPGPHGRRVADRRLAEQGSEPDVKGRNRRRQHLRPRAGVARSARRHRWCR